MLSSIRGSLRNVRVSTYRCHASQAVNDDVVYPSPSYANEVNSVLEKLSSDGPKENLKHFTSFRTRRTSFAVFQAHWQFPGY